MQTLRRIAIALLIAALSSCDNFTDDFTGPSPVTTSTTTTAPARPPRVDRAPDLYGGRGLTSFGAALLSEEDLLAFIYHVMSYGYDILRVGAWTNGWCNSRAVYCSDACGPLPETIEAQENLRRLLDVTSRIPGLTVQLIPTFTNKKHGYTRCAKIMEFAIAIVEAGSEDDPTPYRHVVWEAVNEWKHPRSDLSMSDVTRLLRRLRETGLPVSTDRGGGTDVPWEGYYPPEHLPYVDYIAFHPPRNATIGGKCVSIRPDRRRLRRVIGSFGLPVWLDETTCYISDESIGMYGINPPDGHYAACAGRTEKYRRRFIQEYMEDVEAAGGTFFFHSLWGFSCDRLGWLPS